MKKKYEKPNMDLEMFEANEYIAACYKIKCNVPNGFGFLDINGNGQYDSKTDTKLTGNVSGCGTYHNGVDLPSDPTHNSYWQPTSWWGGNTGTPIRTFYWNQTAPGHQSIHFTRIDNPEWDQNPNAS